MFTRLPTSRWAPCAIALLSLLASCGPERNQFAPACPARAIIADAADFNVYRPGGNDLVDLVVSGRIVGIQGSCREGSSRNQLAVTLNVGVELGRGPAMAGRETEVPIFVAVIEGDTILDKRIYQMRAVFPPNVERVVLTPGDVNLVLPVTAAKSAAAFTVLAGFQVSPGEVTWRNPGG